MSPKPRYFAYVRSGKFDEKSGWREFKSEPTTEEKKSFEEFEVFYDALAVERTVTTYRSFFEEIGKRISVLPEWLQKFYFDMKRRIDNEHQAGNAKEVREGSTTTRNRASRWGADHGKGRV